MENISQAPNVIHLGKKSKKQIKKYKLGVGSMFMEVQQVLAQAKIQSDGTAGVVPLVVVHRKKRKKGMIDATKSLFKKII